MTELLTSLVEKAKTDRVALIGLKNLAVKCQQFQLASQLREMETELFPDTEEQAVAKKESAAIQLIFGMLNLKVSPGTCWLIIKTAMLYNKKKGKFSLKDASEIIADKYRLFPLENES